MFASIFSYVFVIRFTNMHILYCYGKPVCTYYIVSTPMHIANARFRAHCTAFLWLFFGWQSRVWKTKCHHTATHEHAKCCYFTAHCTAHRQRNHSEWNLKLATVYEHLDSHINFRCVMRNVFCVRMTHEFIIWIGIGIRWDRSIYLELRQTHAHKCVV